MRTRIIVRKFDTRIDRTSGEEKLYLEFEMQEPSSIERVNISSLSTEEKNKYQSFIGKEIDVSIEQSEFNNRKFWRLYEGGNPQSVSKPGFVASVTDKKTGTA